MRRLTALPLPVVLTGLAALAMYLPAVHALALDQHRVARAFFYPATLVLALTVMVAIATAGWKPDDPARNHLRSFVLAYAFLPPILALPFAEAVRDTTYFNAWFEMVSAFTTTGATLYEPARLPDPVHLWRGLVGWAGGFFVLMAATGILASQHLGGFEIYAPRTIGRVRLEPGQIVPATDPAQRLLRHAAILLPVYAGLTGLVWLALRIAGDPGLVALMHAMAAVSTSGISPLTQLSEAPSGVLGEGIVALALVFALSRRFMPGAARIETEGPLARDPELRIALAIVVAVPTALFLRHWIGAIEGELHGSLPQAARALLGALFTVLSFLTTTGYASAGWAAARAWSGMDAPWLILLGLAMIGGGVATTAGGVKLLRVYALYKLGRREMDRLAEPSSVGGGGAAARQLRGEGAFVAFVFFMLFALSLGVVNLSLALLGVPFESALVLSVSALSTTGPMVPASQLPGAGWGHLVPAAKAVLAAAMVLGRLETLALLAFLLPAAWRR